MRQIVGRFIAAIGVLSAVVGLYLGAVAVELVWAFWLVIGGAALVAIFPAVLRPLSNAVVAVRNYPSVLRRLGNLQEALNEERNLVKNAQDDALVAYEAGVNEGVARAVGSFLSSMLSEMPTLVCIREQDGSLILVGRYVDPVRVGTRFSVIHDESGDVKGVVHVEDVDHSRKMLDLVCVERSNSAFWRRLEERMDVDQSIPPGIVLRPYEARAMAQGREEGEPNAS